jgi:hypothetical protein
MIDKLTALSTDTLIGIFFSIFLAILCFVAAIKSSRPKLLVNGGGGGSGPAATMSYTSISITNDPNFFGIKIAKEPAQIVMAWLIDNRLKENYPLLNNWRDDTNGNSREALIDCGKSRHLCLFNQLRNNDKYYIYGDNMNITNSDAFFTDRTKEFTLMLRDAVGREYKFDLQIKNTRHNLAVITAVTISQRVQLLKSALIRLKLALRLTKF